MTRSDELPRTNAGELEKLSARAHARATEAAARAAAARDRVLELAKLGRSTPRDASDAALNARHQSERARAAMRHSAEGHERTARLHDDAAAFEDAHGHPERAVWHREAAERARQAALADRDSADDGDLPEKS